jgi:hypothetical protein
VVEILDVAEHEGLQVVDRETSIFNLTDNIAQLDKQFKSLDALGLLDFLKENKETFAEHLNISKQSA